MHTDEPTGNGAAERRSDDNGREQFRPDGDGEKPERRHRAEPTDDEKHLDRWGL